MYSLQLLVIAASILVPATSGLELNSLPLSHAPVVVPPDGDQGAGVHSCPTDLARETAQESIASSVRMLLQSATVEECGEGLWYRVGFLNMSDPTMECPSSWREYSQDNVRACGRPETQEGSCVSTIYTVNNTRYSKVCGRIIGYQHASPAPFDNRAGLSINDTYVDGVSLTYGNPRSHIWTFATGANDGNTTISCPCAGSVGAAYNPVPSFVGDNYFCESGYPGDNYSFDFFLGDPLWDGQNCPRGNCCEFNSPPWFSVDLDGPTTDDLEVRICGDQDTVDEDTPIGLLELYIGVI